MRRFHHHLRLLGILPGALALVFLLPSAALGQGHQVNGHVYWEDENGDAHPLYGARVEIWQLFTDGTPTNFLDETTSREDGGYTIVTPAIVWDGGEATVRVVVRTTHKWVEVAGEGPYPYLGDPQVILEAGGPQVDFTVPGTGTGRAASVFQAAMWAARVLHDRRGSDPPQIPVAWPDTADYFTPTTGGRMGVRESEAFDWDLVQHLYGHYALHVLGMISSFHDVEHVPGLCRSEAMGKSTGTRYAWVEGWSMFYACFVQAEMSLAAQNIPGVGDAIYSDTSNQDIHVDLNAQSAEGRGEDNDLAVARVLWDIYDDDAVPEGRDDDRITTSTFWNSFVDAEARTLHAAWMGLMQDVSPFDGMFVGNVGADHGIGPELLGPADGASLDAPPLLSWTRAVGCSPPVAGDDFDVIFHYPNGPSAFLVVPVGNVTSWQMTDADVQTLRQWVSQDFRWTVAARNGENPATGAYRGETFHLSINRPPDAVITGGLTGDCLGTDGTPLHFSGLGSTDPDGDDLDYSWFAPGIDLSSTTGPTSGGRFPVGETWLYLTVGDGAAENTDSSLVVITDDTPPQILCPASITVDCEEACYNDTAVGAFLDNAVVTDNCDPYPGFTHDAPNCLPVGTNTVTFTAADAAGNTATCTATVTVVDSDPPTITATPLRTLIWPPNKKMAPVEMDVSVADNCDPTPRFVLSEIRVLENGVPLPESQARNEYDGADFGTDDTAVELRAKRSGGTERKYAVVFVATDASGNTAADTACVFVPASQTGTAFASSGFGPDGKSLSERTFSVVIPSEEGPSANSILRDEVFVGNHVGQIRAQSTRYVMRGERVALDLEATFSTQDVLRLMSVSGPSVDVSLHFNTYGADYLVADILDLGAPVRVMEQRTGDGRPEDPLPVEDGTADTAGDGMAAAPDGSGGLYTTHVERPGAVTVEVFTVTGRRVRTVFRQEVGPGTYVLPWDERDASGRPVPSGIYFYRVKQPAGKTVRKVVVLR